MDWCSKKVVDVRLQEFLCQCHQQPLSWAHHHVCGVLEGEIHTSSSHRSPVLVWQIYLSYHSDIFSLVSRCIQFELDVSSKPLSTFPQFCKIFAIYRGRWVSITWSIFGIANMNRYMWMFIKFLNFAPSRQPYDLSNVLCYSRFEQLKLELLFYSYQN